MYLERKLTKSIKMNCMKKMMMLFLMSLVVFGANAQTRTKIKTSELQEKITRTIARDYPGSTIKYAMKAEKNGLTSYEVFIMKEKVESKLVFGKDGQFLRKEVFKSDQVTKNDSKTKASGPGEKKK
jgi:hypothetical protein